MNEQRSCKMVGKSEAGTINHEQRPPGITFEPETKPTLGQKSNSFCVQYYQINYKDTEKIIL